MRIRLPRIALSVALAALVVVALDSAAHAQSPDVATFLTIQPIDTISSGSTIPISVRLTTGRGDPVASKSLLISLTSDLTRAVQTDANGNATYTTRVDLAPGNYTIIISFGGALGLQPSRATEDVVVTGEATETVLTVQPIGPVGIDTNAELQARLTTAHGVPIKDARLQIIVDGADGPQANTDQNGYAFISIGKGNTLGNHKVSVVYRGSKEYAPASQQLNLDIRALDIELHTSPVLEGVRVMVQSKVYTTDKDGIVRIPVDAPGTSIPFHDVNVPGSGPVEAGFNLSYQVRQVFIDLQGRPVDPRRISSMTFKRSDGVIYDFNNGDPRWLAGNYLVRRLDGLDESPFLYSLLSVIVNGTNVVSEQQQRFTAEPKDTWTIQLLLFSANLKSHDMMFGFPLGSGAKLVYPDGMKENIPLNAKGEGQVFSLPRGAYKVGVNTNLGIAPVSSLTMSRDQEVDLKVVSYLDILAVLLVGFVLGPGLLFVGQPKLRQFVLSGALLDYARGAVRKIMSRRSEVETEREIGHAAISRAAGKRRAL
jgi:hypothetical protein